MGSAPEFQEAKGFQHTVRVLLQAPLREHSFGGAQVLRCSVGQGGCEAVEFPVLHLEPRKDGTPGMILSFVLDPPSQHAFGVGTEVPHGPGALIPAAERSEEPAFPGEVGIDGFLGIQWNSGS